MMRVFFAPCFATCSISAVISKLFLLTVSRPSVRLFLQVFLLHTHAHAFKHFPNMFMRSILARVQPLYLMGKSSQLHACPRATLGDLEDYLHSNWRKGTTEDLYALIHEKSNLGRAETAEYIAKLIEEGKIAYDPDGWLK